MNTESASPLSPADQASKQDKSLITPATLRKGDTIAILAPATTVKPEYVEGAAEHLRSLGFKVRVMPSVIGPAEGSYAAAGPIRLGDLHTALLDPEVKCIFCARGGYGCIHLLQAVEDDNTAAGTILHTAAPRNQKISRDDIRRNAKWLVGFSDISALHALWLTSGVKSLHAPMAKHLTLHPDDKSSHALIGILTGFPRMDYEVASHPHNRHGRAEGRLQGGNLAVLNSLAATPFDILTAPEGEDVILFIEDISEAIYAVERMLIRMDLAGVLRRIKGLIVGQFTEYRPDRNFPSMEEMISALLTRCGIGGIPVAFGFPTGHTDYNLPLIEGEQVRLDVTPEKVTLTSTEKTIYA